MSVSLEAFPRQDFIWLSSEAGCEASPGVATIRKANSPREWDVRKGYGFSGAVSVFTGVGLSKFEVEFGLWTLDQYRQWTEFANRYLQKPKPGTRVTSALGISHPVLEAPPLGITAAVVEDVSQVTQDETGYWTVTVSFLEFRRPMPILQRPLASIPAAQKPQPTAQTAAERKMQELTARLNDRVNRR